MQNFFDFDEAERRKKEVDGRIEQLKSSDRDVYIFGAGEYANKLKGFLEGQNLLIKVFFVDDPYAAKVGANPLSKIKECVNFCLVYGIGGGFSREYYKKIDQLKKEVEKCANSVFFVLPSDYSLVESGLLDIHHDVIDKIFLRDHIEEFKDTYEMLEDELSKNVMAEYLYGSICQDVSQLANLGSSWEFDYDLNLLFGKCDEGVVIECGAFDGKTIAEISEFTKNKYEMIALECDDDNFEKCCKRVKDFPNIHVVKLGAWDKRAKLAIIQQDSASYLKEVDDCSEYENVVDVVNVDSLTSKRIAVLIMDIEGSELKALKGAQNAIKNGANLAIRVYHKKEDLITIPQYIKSINANYKFYLRFERGANLCRTGDETTLYAISESP